MNWEPLVFSFEVALMAAVLAGVLGIFAAGLLSQGKFLGRDLVDAIMTSPLVLPPTVLGYYVLVVLGREGAVGRIYEHLFGSPIVFTQFGAVIAATISAFPFVTKSARAAMEDVDPRLVGAAQTLGASSLRIFLTIILPLSVSGIVAGVTLGFARALGDFGVTLMVAGDIPGLTQTGSLAIYDAVQANRTSDATAMSLVMTAIAVAVLYLVSKLTQRRAHGY